jgi:predicted nuclease of predicted toxin-antitoxin system
MTQKKFLIDENVNQKVIRAIPASGKGFDVLYPEDGGYKGFHDAAVRKQSLQEGRTLVTCDRDFSISNISINQVPNGVLWIRPSPRNSQKRVGDLLRTLCEFLVRTFPADPYNFQNKIFEVHETGVKIITQQGETAYDF